MARLTEEMVIARTRASDLSNIRKLNCWGSELSDVSLLRRMQNVEVLSLSVNKIGTLSDFQFCRNLQELYVRKNNIRELNQILYLQDLPRLKCLWLEENPCADTDQYRLTVLRTLPNLQKLDNIAVQPEEVQDALRKGRELVHPEDIQDVSPATDRHWGSGSSSPSHSPTQHEEYIPQVYYREYEEVEHTARIPSVGQTSPPRRQGTGERESETTDVRRHSALIHDDEYHTSYETDRCNANYGAYIPTYSQQQSSPYEEEDPKQRVSTSDKGLSNSRPLYPRRPITRSSNILSAVLCLIKELDYPNLEVVEMAVRSRMDEL
ncbi:uncharacterized protein LOC110837050 isoform X5 [Zootermopsis nevadensis]|uniref:uncharacterized protein LOC110837050 isoform X5 n=1 Tax=Zootermopsis nevadensis TaxID=136037 RepID=UPI000B8EA7CA|nr:uncharacterized protein LOC110837050 isoform X5 [Zootermopsis nevadensis]